MRFLTVLGLIAAAGYGAMLALTTYVEPRPREMVVNVSLDHFPKPSH